MDCVICPAKGAGNAYTVIRGRDVCMRCVDIIVRLFPERAARAAQEEPTLCRHLIPLEATQDDEGEWQARCGLCPVETCAGCGVDVIEVEDNAYSKGYLDWWPLPDLPDYHPCADENGLPAAHRPE